MTNYEPPQNSRFSYMLVLVLALLVTYLSAVTAGFMVVDDIDTIKHLHLSNFSLEGLLAANGARYYRPLAILSLIADKSLFGTNPAAFHAVNIAIHLCNALLVYYLALELVGNNELKDNYALLASLIFALHPVGTEAVLWISARPDLLSCFFFLLSLILIVRNVPSATAFSMVLLFCSSLSALLSKESSVCLWLLWLLYYISEREKIIPRRAVAITFVLFTALMVYFYLRVGIKMTGNKGIINVISNDDRSSSLFLNSVSAYGFYLRKLLFPLPLTFIIVTINKTRYLLFFLLLLGPASILFLKQRDLRLPLLIIITGIVPPILAMIGKLPFTLYAERYLYIPLTGFSLFAAIFLLRYCKRIPYIVILATVLLTAVPTVHRVNDWADPIRFWTATATQSTLSPIPHLVLAAELINKSDYPEAKKHINEAYEIGLKRDIDRQFAIEMLHIIEQPSPISPSTNSEQ
jgi:protein O-mannosyl-transferase